MKPVLLVALLSLSSFGLIGNFNDSNLTVGLFSQPIGAVSTNTGTIIPVKGPDAPVAVTATFDRVPETFGWRSDLQSYQFDSTTSNIKFSNNIGNLAENKLTVALWMQMDDFTGEKSIWAKVIDFGKKIVIHRQHTDTFEIRVCDGSGSSFIDFLRPEGNAEPTKWFSLITVIDVTQAENTERIKVYINGIPCAIAGTPGAIPAALPNLINVPLRVGGWGHDAPKVGINGEIKYMLTFNTAKTAADVSALYALGPDLGGLTMDSTGNLCCPTASNYHLNQMNFVNVYPVDIKQVRYGVDLIGRRINTRVLTGGIVLNRNKTMNTGLSSGYYLIRNTGFQTRE